MIPLDGKLYLFYLSYLFKNKYIQNWKKTPHVTGTIQSFLEYQFLES